MKTLDEIRPAITSLKAIPAIPAIVQPLASMLQLPVEHVAETTSDPALVFLLCRLRDLGYGYYEGMGVDLASDEAWLHLLKHCPQLEALDLARLTLDIDGAMDEIVALVDTVLHPDSATSA